MDFWEITIKNDTMKKLVVIKLIILSACISFYASAQGDFLKTISEPGVNINAVDMKYLGNGEMLVLCSYIPNGGNADLLLVKMDENNSVLQKKRYGTTAEETPRKLLQNSAGNWVMVGETGNTDLLFIEVNSTSWAIVNQFRYAGSSTERIRNAAAVTGGFILTANTNTWGGGSLDIMLIKIDNFGNTLWSQILGGSGVDGNCHAQENTATGKICFAGNFSSGSTNDDVVVGELNADGTLCWLNVVRKSGNPAEGGHDMTVYDNHMYVVGISSGNEALLLKVELPDHTANPGCTGSPSLVFAKEFGTTGVRESFSNITEINGRLFISGNQGANPNRDLYALEVNTAGAPQNEWLITETGNITSGVKCEFNLDNDDLYFCGRSSAHGTSGLDEGLVVRQDMSDAVSCLVEVDLERDPVTYALHSLTLGTHYQSSHCDNTGSCTRLDEITTSLAPQTDPDVVVTDHCGCSNEDGAGFIRKLIVEKGVHPNRYQQDVEGIDVVRVSDDEYVMLVASEDIVGAAGDFMLMWFDANGLNTKTFQYGTELDDIPKKLFFHNNTFFVTGSTLYNDLNDAVTNDYNFFMVSIDNNPGGLTPHDIVNAGIFDINQGNDMARSSTICNNGDIVISGVSDNLGDWDHVHVRVLPSCASLWDTQLQHAGSDNQASAIEASNGDFWITGTFWNGSSNNIVLGRLSSGGTLLSFTEYEKSVTSSTPNSGEVGHDVMISGNNVLFGGMYNDGVNNKDGLLGIFNTTTSSTTFYSYGSSTESEAFLKFENVNNRLLFGGRFENGISLGTGVDFTILEMDASGTVLNTKYFGDVANDTYNKSRIVEHNANKDLYFCGTSLSFNNVPVPPVGGGGPFEEAIFMRIDQDLNLTCHSACGDPQRTEITDLEESVEPGPAALYSRSLDNVPTFMRGDESHPDLSICEIATVGGGDDDGVGPFILSLEEQNLEISVFPNPANNELTISGDAEISNLQIIAITGKVVYDNSLVSNSVVSIDVSDIPAGYYFVKMLVNSEVVSTPINIMH